jgi:ring-1,2-phenylacetyl-CoA epoxidase subunit PaaC
MAGAPLFEFLVRMGDDRLVLGQRTAEWCGHGPILEEDIALANISLDLFGQGQLFLNLAGQVEGVGRDADALAYWRDEREFRNLQMLELPRGDFAFTIVRQCLFSSWSRHYLELLSSSTNDDLAGIAAKSAKENRYHLRHASEWVVRLGGGTDESHRRVQAALDELWPWTGELFYQDEVDRTLAADRVVPDNAATKAPWEATIGEVLKVAGLTPPTAPLRSAGGRLGRHTEFLGHLLAEFQILARSHPGAKW